MALPLERPSADAPREGGRDPVLLVGSAVWLLALLPSFAPILPAETTVEWADLWSDIPVLLILLWACWGRARGSEAHERVFWQLLCATVASWLAVRSLYALVPLEYWGPAIDVATDSLYIASYMAIALAIERRPDRGSAQRTPSGGRELEMTGLLVFAFGLVTYLVLSRSVFDPAAYATWAPSLFFYAAIDLYLVLRSTALSRKVDPAWRSTFRWLRTVFLLWFVGDLAEGLIYLGVLPWIDPGTPADVVWMAPSLVLLVAIRSAPSGPEGGRRSRSSHVLGRHVDAHDEPTVRRP